MSERIEQIGESVIVYDDSIVNQMKEELFDPQYWGQAETVPGYSGGRGSTLFVRYGQDDWVLRHYYRGGAAGNLLRDQFLWLGAARTRPMREWSLLRDIQQLTLPAPIPVAARYVTRGIYYTADLITRRLPDVIPLSRRLQQGPAAEEVWSTVGRCVKRFHAENIFHADLTAHNIQIDPADLVYLLDFDRGRRMESAGRWQVRNLARLHRSFSKISADGGVVFGAHEWRCLLDGYNSAVPTAPQS